jgi:hypothetical protein
MSDQPVRETSTWQQTTLTTDRHPYPPWDSNPQSQQPSGRTNYALDRAVTETGKSLVYQLYIYYLYMDCIIVVQIWTSPVLLDGCK